MESHDGGMQLVLPVLLMLRACGQSLLQIHMADVGELRHGSHTLEHYVEAFDQITGNRLADLKPGKVLPSKLSLKP